MSSQNSCVEDIEDQEEDDEDEHEHEHPTSNELVNLLRGKIGPFPFSVGAKHFPAVFPGLNIEGLGLVSVPIIGLQIEPFLKVRN